MADDPERQRIAPRVGSDADALARKRLSFRPSAFAIRLRAWLARDWLPMLALALAALALCWPLLGAPRTRIIGPPVGDNVQYVYMTGWVGQSLLLGRSPLVDPRLNYPGALALATTDAPFMSMLLAAPFTWALGPVFAYNLIIAASGWLSGYAAYLWVRSITGSRLGGLVAGLAFMLAPFRVAHAYGHLQLVSTQGLPLFFWALDAAARGGRGAQGGGPSGRLYAMRYVALAAATALVGAGAMYYLLIALVTGALYALVALAGRLAERAWRPDKALIGAALGMVVAVGAGAVVSALPYLDVWREGGFVPYALDEIRKRSANPLDFALPSILHPLWGAPLQAWMPGLQAEWIERTLYLGAVPLALAAVALWPGGIRRSLWLPWLATALLGVLLALGTDLHWNNQPLEPESPFWLPAAYLAQLPFASLLRVWTRFAIVPILFVALLAGVGAARLQATGDRRQATGGRRRGFALRLSPVVLLALLVVDLAPGNIAAGELRPRPVDLWLAEQPGDFAAAFLPQIDDGVNYVAMYGSLFHGKHLPAYNHPAHKSADYDRFRDLADRFPVTAETFPRLGLRLLLLRRADYDGVRFPEWAAVERALAQSPTLRVVDEVDGYVVVEARQR
jgi:hypothetical protein